jgi:hypothetical protein
VGSDITDELLIRFFHLSDTGEKTRVESHSTPAVQRLKKKPMIQLEKYSIIFS